MTSAASPIFPEPGTFPLKSQPWWGATLWQFSPAAQEGGTQPWWVTAPVPPQSLCPMACTDLHRLHPPLVPLLVVDDRAVLACWLVPCAMVNHILQRKQQQKRFFAVSS